MHEVPPDGGAPTASRPVIHLSDLLGRPVVAKAGDAVGRVEDVIVSLRGAEGGYPPVTGLVVGIGGRRVYVSSGQITDLTQEHVDLSKNKVDLREFERRDGEVLLRTDVLDHRLIDVAAAELVHAYDIELEDTGGGLGAGTAGYPPAGAAVRVDQIRWGGMPAGTGSPSNRSSGTRRACWSARAGGCRS